MELLIHLSTYNTSYGQKKSWELKCQFDSWPLKVGSRPKLRVCRRHATDRWKSFNNNYNFTLNLASIGGHHKNFLASKMAGVPISRIVGLLT